MQKVSEITQGLHRNLRCSGRVSKACSHVVPVTNGGYYFHVHVQLYSRYFRLSKNKGKRTTTSECQAISNVDQYRTLDGTCNNINNPDWGAAFSTQPRFLDEVYSNGGEQIMKNLDF